MARTIQLSIITALLTGLIACNVGDAHKSTLAAGSITQFVQGRAAAIGTRSGIWLQLIKENMALADIKEIKDERTTQERARAAIKVYAPKFDELRREGQPLVRKGQHLDVDGILARSFKDVKPIVLR